jgi:hypothetical protein
MLTLACGPYFSRDGLLASLAVFFVFQPLAYYAFIQAFRYRVSRAIPMTFRQAGMLAAYRADLGVLLVGGGAVLLHFVRIEWLWQWSWAYLYAARAGAWFVLGRRGATLRGRRLAGWIIWGTLMNLAFDAAFVSGALMGWVYPAGILLLIAGSIAALHIAGRRTSLRARFSGAPLCMNCDYNLAGNLSGRCPECGGAIQNA